PAEAVENVLKHLPKHRREEVREMLRTCMEDYTPSGVNLEEFFQNGQYECEAACRAGLPPWVRHSLAKGWLAPFISNALVLRSVFLRTQVENMRRASAHSAALPIRRVIYGLLLLLPAAPPCAETPAPSEEMGKVPVVCEFDRLQTTLRKTFVEATRLPTGFCDDGFPLGDLLEVPVSCRQMLLLETLGVKMSFLESIPRHLQLTLAVTCYWVHHSEPKVELHHLKALLLMIVSGELHGPTNDPGFTVGPSCTDWIKSLNQHLQWKICLVHLQK
ncbi:PREDICTED: protein asteroid homolog 1, partial [Apaloderma vittatum]|uniref:protein asteroid homolog 1 n=1 Tax=Apaloderma vittatum TaxID=57397 RepID=UPI0005214FA6